MQFFGGSDVSPSPPVPTGSGNNAHMMYVFNRNGICLLYREWNRPLKTLNAQQDYKLMFGLLFSLKSLTAKMDPTSVEKGNLGVPQLPGQGCSFHSFRTNTYKLSFMETPSGIKIILVTNPRTGDLRESLKHIYNLYVEYVVKNPLYSPGTPINLGVWVHVYCLLDETVVNTKQNRCVHKMLIFLGIVTVALVLILVLFIQMQSRRGLLLRSSCNENNDYQQSILFIRLAILLLRSNVLDHSYSREIRTPIYVIEVMK